MVVTPSVQSESASEKVSLSESKTSGFRAADGIIAQVRILLAEERCERGLLLRMARVDTRRTRKS